MTHFSTSPADHITLIANPYSVHVLRWLKLFRLAQVDVRIETAERSGPVPEVDVPVTFVVPSRLRGPMALRYLWMGIALWRKRLPPGSLLHAHCTSGSGFTAWLSGHPYIVTTYGSEIFGAAERGRAYQWMIRQVLQRATLVTATTPRMTQVLCDEFDVPAERIRMFSLGYDSEVFHEVDEQSRGLLRDELDLPRDERVWVVNRRSLPLYRTLEVVTGFLQHCEQDGQGRLVVLCGDDDPAYTKQVRSAIAESESGARVRLIREFLPARDVATWLQAADFAISVPKSDQLSTSILEAMACGAVPVLSDLESYVPLDACPAVHRLRDCSPGGFAGMFRHLGALADAELFQRQVECARFVRARYSEAGLVGDVRALFGLPSCSVELQQKAA